MDPMRDGSEKLVERLRQGDIQALGEVFSRHRERLRWIVQFRLSGLCAGRADADDVLQEAYLAAVQRIDHFTQSLGNTTVTDDACANRDGYPSPFIWLRLIVQQTLVDVHRRHLGAQMRDAGREVSLFARPGPQSTSASMAVHLVGDATSPSMAAARGEAVEAVRAAIESMDPLDQEVLALRHFEELTNAEVAEVLGIQVKAASIRYIRALRRLKQLLGVVPGLAERQGDGA